MFARTTTFGAQPEAIDDAIAQVRDEVMPAVQAMEGCTGLSMLVDRESGRSIVTTAWESEEAMRASEGPVRALRDRAIQTVMSGLPEVQEWEIAALHRHRPVGETGCARVTWLQVDPARAEEQIAVFRSHVLPRLEELPGFCSASLLVDRATGRAVTAVTYESREAMEESRQAAMSVRADATRAAAAAIFDIAELDLVLAHLRVPETV